jgi:hypothetical protein
VTSLLAVDLGLRTGLALYGPDARLVWYRSQHFGSRASLRRGVHGLLDASPDVSHLVLEGGGPIRPPLPRSGWGVAAPTDGQGSVQNVRRSFRFATRQSPTVET